MPPRSNKQLNFEQAMNRLEEISALLDNPETGLEDTINLVEEGLKLIRSSRKLLDNAEMRIKVLENPQAEQVALLNEKKLNDEHDFTLH
jgi:exodeoxyribonuclease VII small subunit